MSSFTIPRYAEGTGTKARLGSIFDMVLIDSTKNLIVFNDHPSCCLRSFRRDELTTAQFAGKCTVCGNVDGPHPDARLRKIHTLVYDAYTGSIFMNEKLTGRLKQLFIETGEIVTIAGYDTGVISSFKDFQKASLNTDSFYILGINGLFKSGNGSLEQLMYPVDGESGSRMVSLSPHLFVMNSGEKNSAIIFDANTNNSESICEKNQMYSDSSIMNCSLADSLYQLTASGNSIYMATANRDEIRLNILQGKKANKV